MKRLLILMTICCLALLTAPAQGQFVNEHIEDVDLMNAEWVLQWGDATIDGGYPQDTAGPGVHWMATPTISSGWRSFGIGDNFSIADIYGFPVIPVSGGDFGDWTGYTHYRLLFTNHSTNSWFIGKAFYNTDSAGYWHEASTWVPPGESRTVTIDLSVLGAGEPGLAPDLATISNFGFEIGTNVSSTPGDYEGDHFDFTVSAEFIPNVAADASGLCISTATPCVTVPVIFDRGPDTTSARGISVTFSLSSELELCVDPATSITQGSWLPGNTNFQVVDEGGGVYTVDQVTLGLPCGVKTGGTLFTLDLTNSGADGIGTITVDSVDVRGCDNAFLPGQPGPPANLPIDNTPPSAVGDLGASQVKSGNDTDGTTEITLTWSAVETGATVATYRKGFGDYPEYDDGTGAEPSAPTDTADATANGWILTGVTTSGGADETDTERDFWYFVAFVTDSCGNESGVSNRTDGTLNYHLGDVVPLASFGDNEVEFLDISKLGAHYGTEDGVDSLYLDTLDVGPTGDFSVDGLPTTDDRIQFEDLIMFAINHEQVSKPMPPSLAAAGNALRLVVNAESGSQMAAAIELASDGSIQGASIPLTWNAEVVEPVGFSGGDLLNRQGGQAVLLSPCAGTVDAVVLGSCFHGEGLLATVIFHRKAEGDPAIGFGRVLARDARNKPVELAQNVGDRVDPVLPAVTRLLPSRPNPFAAGTVIRLALPQETQVRVRVYSVNGRLVRDLMNEFLPAGEQEVAWDGLDYAGRPVASGSYLIEMEAGNVIQSQRVVRLR